MNLENLIPCVSMHAASPCTLKPDNGVFYPTNVFELNDALVGNINLVSRQALINTAELHKLYMCALLVHRDVEGVVHMLASTPDSGGISICWSSRYLPKLEDLASEYSPLHDLGSSHVLRALANLDIYSTDTPGGAIAPMCLDNLRRECDLTVVGFHTYEDVVESSCNRNNGKVLQIDSVINIRKNLYEFMVGRGFTWIPMDQNMNQLSGPELAIHSKAERLVNFCAEHTYDNVVTINPGLE